MAHHAMDRLVSGHLLGTQLRRHPHRLAKGAAEEKNRAGDLDESGSGTVRKSLSIKPAKPADTRPSHGTDAFGQPLIYERAHLLSWPQRLAE